MKLRDTKTKRFELRMTEEEYELLQLTAEHIGRTPTEFIRLLLNGAYTEMRDVIEKGETRNENLEAICNDKLQ